MEKNEEKIIFMKEDEKINYFLSEEGVLLRIRLAEAKER